MPSSTTHETFRQIAVRAADAEQGERLAPDCSVGEVLRAVGLRECGERSRVDADGDPWSALLTTR
jgi:hypothetical protein